MGTALVSLGSLLMLVGVIWIAVTAFQSGDLVWGILSLLCLIATVIYALQHMDKTRNPLYLLVGGIVLEIVGGVLGGFSIR